MSILFNLLLLFVIFWTAIAILFKREIKSVFRRDPAATSYIEVLLTYSGLHAIIFYRISHALLKMRVPFFPRYISQLGRFFTGIEIHPGAEIGKEFFIDHGMGVVIGETTILGDNVLLYQGVTLGGTGKERGKRHPTIGDNVVIGAGAKILGNITIGDNSYIGSNAVVIRNVPPNSTVVGVPGRITKQEGKPLDMSLDHIHVLDPILQEMEELKKRLDKLEK
ncbi:MAG: serine O-acetyltransferase EpsC [Candidatus Omnitrophota bacterium]|nr:serine O-acetyltransferase EpsC [Candidatus Omnitrophota bacterium]